MLDMRASWSLGDYTVKGTAPAANLFLQSKTSFDAKKTYIELIGYGVESLTPGFTSEMLTSNPPSPCAYDVGGTSADGQSSTIVDTTDLNVGILLVNPRVKLSLMCSTYGIN